MYLDTYMNRVWARVKINSKPTTLTYIHGR